MAHVLTVTHSPQTTEGGCLAACVQMVLAYWGIQRSQADLGRQMRAVPHIGAIGRNVLRLQSPDVQVVYAQGSLELLRAWLAKGTPVIAFVQTSELPYWKGVEARHAVVVIGLDDANVYLLDPAQESDSISVSIGDFLLAWEDWMDGRCVVITRVH